jgi:branched-chain amino acid aminotransferase
MAGFEGIRWASRQMRYLLTDKQFELLEAEAKVYAVSRSIHYGAFLAFEGIRFFCKKTGEGRPEVILLNWDKNLERFRRGMAFNLGHGQQNLVPTAEELEHVFIHLYLQDETMRSFLLEMADLGAQGYLRPFTLDEEQSIGVTFPNQPSVRAVVSRYDRYLGEPFCGVVIPHVVRAIGVNKTGCLKLGVNYLMSVKAVDEARKISPEAVSALFLDDNTSAPVKERNITEWDSSCCLFGFTDGTVVKIPESSLILPSVTIGGIATILKGMGIRVEERHLSYGELLTRAKAGELVAVCSVGTAGILNRCQKLVLTDGPGVIAFTHHPDENHALYKQFRRAREFYWDIYQEKVPAPAGMKLFKYAL